MCNQKTTPTSKNIMATIQEVVESRLKRYYIELDAVGLDEMLANAGLVAADNYTSSHDVIIKTAFVSIIPELLLRPDITESGYSEKFDRTAIVTFYSMLCKELRLPDKLNVQPKTRNKSNKW